MNPTIARLGNGFKEYGTVADYLITSLIFGLMTDSLPYPQSLLSFLGSIFTMTVCVITWYATYNQTTKKKVDE